MEKWLDIKNAPKDGTVIELRRIYDGQLVAEGCGLFGTLHSDAPARRSISPDPLSRPSIVSDATINEWIAESADQPRWMREDRMYRFPEPTHWRPAIQGKRP